jgi:hypothetical protein
LKATQGRVEATQGRIERLTATMDEMRALQGRLAQILDVRAAIDALQADDPGYRAAIANISLEQRLSEYVARASAGTKALLLHDTYADFIFTNGAEIMEGRAPIRRTDIKGHAAVDCASIQRDGLKVIISAGQSNAANTTPVDQVYEPRNIFYNLNVDDGR